MPQESLYNTREFLETAERTDGLRLEVARTHYDTAADPVVLHIVPDPFIGVKIRRVRRQEKYAQTPVGLLLHELADLLGLVHRMAVHDEEDLPRNTVQQRLQEIDELPRVHLSLLNPETQLTARGNRRYHVHRLPLASRDDDRGLADGRPRGPGVVVGPYAGLICEEDAGALLGCQLADLRVSGFLPFLHTRRVLLISAVQRPLRRQPHLVQQPAHLDFRELDPE